MGGGWFWDTRMRIAPAGGWVGCARCLGIGPPRLRHLMGLSCETGAKCVLEVISATCDGASWPVCSFRCFRSPSQRSARMGQLRTSITNSLSRACLKQGCAKNLFAAATQAGGAGQSRSETSVARQSARSDKAKFEIILRRTAMVHPYPPVKATASSQHMGFAGCPCPGSSSPFPTCCCSPCFFPSGLSICLLWIPGLTFCWRLRCGLVLGVCSLRPPERAPGRTSDRQGRASWLLAQDRAAQPCVALRQPPREDAHLRRPF